LPDERWQAIYHEARAPLALPLRRDIVRPLLRKPRETNVVERTLANLSRLGLRLSETLTRLT
jgi:hypothetical protein